MIMKKLYQLTVVGKKELEAELAVLISRRSEVAEKISEARDFGDLSENAEYDVAREEQGLVETRISEIEDILMNTEIIKGGNSSKIALGSSVELKTGKKNVNYTIVGPVEADPMSGKVSNESPLGRALFGKKTGDEVVIDTPRGMMTYKIESVN
ncbi:MAG: transcription elongation factor GreA [Candidatus Saccharibacteria bacterium]